MKARRMTVKEEIAIDSLIPKATKAANRIVGGNSFLTEKEEAKWTRVYHETMDRLAIEQGLRVRMQEGVQDGIQERGSGTHCR